MAQERDYNWVLTYGGRRSQEIQNERVNGRNDNKGKRREQWLGVCKWWETTANKTIYYDRLKR